jgi:hypothetical protein
VKLQRKLGFKKETTCQSILTTNLGKHPVAAKFEPRLLSENQKQNSVDDSRERLSTVQMLMKTFLMNIVTSDKTLCFTAVMSKQKPSVGSGSHTRHTDPKQVRQFRSNVKVMAKR